MPQGWGPPTSPPRTWPGGRNRGASLWSTRAGDDTGIPNYLGWAVLCTVFFFTPAGVVGIIASLVARRRARAGDLEGGQRASRTARASCWVSVVLGLFAYLLLFTGVFHFPNSG